LGVVSPGPLESDEVHGTSGSVNRPIGKSPADLAKEKRSSKAIQKQVASKSRQAPGAMRRLRRR
jgi:hypothetical protein